MVRAAVNHGAERAPHGVRLAGATLRRIQQPMHEHQKTERRSIEQQTDSLDQQYLAVADEGCVESGQGVLDHGQSKQIERVGLQQTSIPIHRIRSDRAQLGQAPQPNGVKLLIYLRGPVVEDAIDRK